MEEITQQNYYKSETNKNYMSVSQFKDFIKCPECALAKIRGDFIEEKSTALLVGSFIDAYYSGELEEFKNSNPEIFNSKTGELKKEFKQAEDIIDFINKDELLLKYLNGEHQVIVKGEIAGVPFKGKIDSYFPHKAIVDQKIMKDLEPIWDEKSHSKKNLIDYWGYTIQGAVYQELVRQQTGEKLPFILAITTKERIPKKALFRIDDEDLEKALEIVKQKAPLFQKMKLGEVSPSRCEDCDYCRLTYKVTGVKSFHEIDPYSRES